MTSEDPIPLDQDPMQSWIGVAHSGGLCTLGVMGHAMLGVHSVLSNPKWLRERITYTVCTCVLNYNVTTCRRLCDSDS